VSFDNGDEPRFMGASSGIAMTRLVMERAKENMGTKSIREIVPDLRRRQIKQRTLQHPGPVRPSFPMISSVAAPKLPSRDVTDKLVDVFILKCL
jgi:hypothetical protein